MIIRNVMIYTADQRFAAGSVRTDGGRISEVILDRADCTDGAGKLQVIDQQEEVIDGQGCYCIPGMIDLHFHGCKGHDICDGTMEALEAIAAFEASIGVTAICPATMTLPQKELEAVLQTAAAFRKRQQENGSASGADLVGVNMEGPFISRVKKGAQDERHIIPCDAEISEAFSGHQTAL